MAISFYGYESKSIEALNKEKMHSLSSSISSKIITSYMNDEPLIVREIAGFEISLYDEEKTLIKGKKQKDVEFKEGFYRTKEFEYLVDLSPQMHHGVKYLITKSIKKDDEHIALIKNILLISFSSIFVIVIVGYFLSKMFLKPIQNERLKLDKFIKDSTHELNTPITAILMSVERLKKQNIDEKILQRVEISSKRVQKIYADLTYLLLEDNHKEVKSINLKEALLGELALYEDLALKKSITIEKDLEDVYISMDESSVQRLFSNLLSNAIKYNKNSGYIKIVLNKEIFSITNSGKTINKASQEKVFERYYRQNKHEGGFGIGLDIVKRVSQMYNLEIELSSNEQETEIKLHLKSTTTKMI
ncbi:MAG: HAMP domain-containing histidine kinase [Sulfurimonas sp.]|uniref:sensor histidine kinase n=1 Tax=Sulfurimonas sp. TaxID=2022749 RepID=UPI0025CBD01C|nr:HAMP domain-containing sensor histidine kinase [Sulfurimonas sp.]MCK9491049.1 HAMP domain-containing histidine kinase [Sulfurimonas sp.]